MNQYAVAFSAIITAIIGLAIVAVIVSKNSQTGSVVSSAGTALSSLINAAVSPVVGSTTGFGVTSNTGGALQ